MFRDLLGTFRWLRRSPLFTLTITAILALGIGANTAIFSLVDAVLLRPLPYAAADRMVRIQATSAKNPTIGISAREYFPWRARTDLFEKTIPFVKDVSTMTGAGDPDQVWVFRVPGEMFATLGARPRLGRTLVESDDGAVVLSYRLWQRHFQGDPAVVGRTIALTDQAYTIVGVMPPDFDFPRSDVEVWAPLRLTPSATTRIELAARLANGKTAQQAQSAMEPIADEMRRADPRNNAGLRILVEPWRDERIGEKYEQTLVLVLAAVGLVLLIACADVSSLLVSRAIRRQREIAIRAALGGGFWRMARQLLIESFTLATLGGIAGLAAAAYLLRFLTARIAALPIVLPHLQRVALDGRVLIFSAVLLLLIACLCTVAPLWTARRADLQSVLRGGQGSTGSGSRIFAALIAAEAAFAFLLLAGSGLMVRSLIRLQQSDHGFRPDHVLTMRVPLGSLTQPRPAGKDTRPLQIAYYHDLMQRLERIPSIGAIAVVNNLPLSGVNTTTILKGPEGETVLNSTRTISPQYFAAMGIPLLAGRIFSDADRADAPRVAIINQFLAHQLFPERDPIGQTLPGEGGPGAIVVGVVKDSAQMAYDQPAKGEIYAPYTQFIFGAFMSTIVVRTAGHPLAIAGMLKKEIWAYDPKQPILKIESMDDVVAESIWRPRFSAWLFSVLGALALALTATGVYGVVAYTTALRVREVGIRVTLGATPVNVITLVLRGAFVPLILGLAAGAAGAMLSARALTSLLYETRGSDPATYAVSAAVLLAIGALAAIRPAWNAAQSDPLDALRAE
ncbi:MAG TPA: ABC transporter permease [Bryobacteraceae bacterium]|nr:ABC transporter permease [Bryobacteraceae bacterium]